MSRTYTIHYGDDETPYEVEMVRTYRGRPATGPSYASGGEQAEPPEFEVVSISPKPPKEVEEAIVDAAYDKALNDDWDDNRYYWIVR